MVVQEKLKERLEGSKMTSSQVLKAFKTVFDRYFLYANRTTKEEFNNCRFGSYQNKKENIL